MRRATRWVYTLLLAGLVGGCAQGGYYWQSVRGHLALMAARRPITELLAGDGLDARRRRQLRTALAVRRFASERLGLPDNDSYRSYVELGRPFVVWSVVAAPEFSLTPRRWCFPVVGCVAYRGYFRRADAEAFAARLRAEGWEVAVGGVRAYSSLGWFADPLLSSMVDAGDLLMAEVIFHELAHQRLYVAGDTAFNEAFATAVGESGVRRWLAETRPADLPRYERFVARRDQFVALLQRVAADLRALYASDLPAADKRRRKAARLRRLRTVEYPALKARWGGWSGYDGWFAQPVNNARLAAIATYRERVPDFLRWLAACDGDLPRVYAAMGRLAHLSAARREAVLRGPAQCPAAAAGDGA